MSNSDIVYTLDDLDSSDAWCLAVNMVVVIFVGTEESVSRCFASAFASGVRV